MKTGHLGKNPSTLYNPKKPNENNLLYILKTRFRAICSLCVALIRFANVQF